jgi:hypothetical protein
MRRILTKTGQAIVTDFGAVFFLIERIIIIGRKHGVFAGADGAMNRIVSAAAAQTSKDAVTFPAGSIVSVGARERPLNAAHPGQKQAGENDANRHFGDRLHILVRHAPKGREEAIALDKEDVNRDFVCPRFRLHVILKYIPQQKCFSRAVSLLFR